MELTATSSAPFDSSRTSRRSSSAQSGKMAESVGSESPYFARSGWREDMLRVRLGRESWRDEVEKEDQAEGDFFL
jgi:hypothetical protein